MRPWQNVTEDTSDDAKDAANVDPKTDYEPPEEESNANQPGGHTGQGG